MASTRLVWKKKVGAALGAGVLMLGAVLLAGGEAGATHYPPGSSCYDCHAISESKMVVGTKLIKKSQKTIDLNITGSSTPIRCLFCHERNAVSLQNRTEMMGVWEHFGSSSLSKHRALEQSTFTPNASTLDCLDCHTGINTPVLSDGAGNANVHGVDASAANAVLLGETLIGGSSGSPVADYDTCANAACHGGAGNNPYGDRTAMQAHGWGSNTINDGAGATGCADCHGTHNSYQNTSLVILRTDGTTSNNPTDNPTTVVTPQMCGECHTQDDDVDPAPGVQTDWALRGHGGSAYTGRSIGLNCLGCHDSNKPHTFDATAVDKRFSLPVSAGLSGMATGKSMLSICVTCHDNFVAHKGQAGCLDCHDPHGQNLGTPGDYNIMMVRREVPLATPTDTMEFYKSGVHDYLYDTAEPPNQIETYYYWTDTNLDTSPDGNGTSGSSRGICDNADCHGGLQNPSSHDVLPLVNYIDADSFGTEHGLGQGGSQVAGSNCQACHQHSITIPDAGFAGAAACDDCHGFPPNRADPFVDNANAVGVHDTHIAIYGSSNCSYCHFGNVHNQAGWASNTGSTIPPAFVQVSFAPAIQVGAAGSYDSATNTCSNLTCHNPDDSVVGRTGKGDPSQVTRSAPRWLDRDGSDQLPASTEARNPGTWEIGDTGEECEACHLNSVAANPDGGSHYDHDNPAARGYDCRVCHAGENSTNNQYSASHADGVLDDPALVAFNFALAGVPGGGSYVDAGGVAGGQCQNLYCHGTTLNAAGTHAATPNWPIWGTQATGTCGACHDTGTFDSTPVTAIATGNHTDHLTATYGPQFGAAVATGCSNCHPAYALNGGSHVNGTKDFDNIAAAPPTSPLGTLPVTAATPTDTDVCTNCHSTAPVNGVVGTTAAKAGWSNPATQLDCLTCHNGTDPATDNAAGNTGAADPTAPDVAGDDSSYGAEVRGHNRATGNYPVTGNPPANRACGDCHNLNATHFNNQNDTTYAGNRMRADINGGSGISTVTGACQACHSTAAASPATKKDVNTHSNVGYGARLEGATFTTQCAQCHDAHGMVFNGTGVNLYMIAPTITVATGVTAPGVRLEALTGNFSYNDTLATAGDDLCLVCHTNASNPNFPMTHNTGGAHAAPNYDKDERGKNCASCHIHNQDASLATADGLMPLSCNGCHTYPGLPNLAGTHRMSASHDVHVGVPSTEADVPNKGFSCDHCHNGSDHNTAGITNASQWNAVVAPNVNTYVQVRFDTVWNPAATNPAPLTQDSASFDDLNNVCNNLYCHGADAATFPVADQGTDTTPDWDLAATGDCGTCHRATAATPPSFGAHVTHAGSAAGYGIGCNVCHYTVTSNGTTINVDGSNLMPLHVNREANVAFNAAADPRVDAASSYSGNLTVNSGFGACSATYCHSSGTDLSAPYNAVGSAPATALSWELTGGCGDCHGNGLAPVPVYLDGTPKANKHPKHVVENTYGCQQCHYPTTQDGATIASRANHVNRAYNADDNSANNPALDDFTYAAGSCSATACHGGNTVAWNYDVGLNGHFPCEICHGMVGGNPTDVDVNNFVRNGSAQSKISQGEYFGFGHGAVGLASCLACHDSDVPHDTSTDLSGGNPFRLADQVPGGAVDFTCSFGGVGCHEAGTVGPETGLDISTLTTHAPELMDGLDKRTWPSWRPDCVNCHDPHGDQATGQAAGNLSMIQREVYDKAAFNLPGSAGVAPPSNPTEQTNLAFVDNATGANAAGTTYADLDSPFSSLCQECHEAADHQSFRDNLGGGTASGANHPATGGNPGDCSTCHQHDSAFKPSGCNGCHGDLVSGQYWPDGVGGNPAYVDDSFGGAVTHGNHVAAISGYLYGEDIPTLLADTGNGTTEVKQKAICSFCHPDPGGAGHTADVDLGAADPAGRVSLYRDTDDTGAQADVFRKFDFGPGAVGNDVDGLNGSQAYQYATASCLNLSCHNLMQTPTPTSSPVARQGNWDNPPLMDGTFLDDGRTFRVGCFVCHGYYGPPRTPANAELFPGEDFRDDTHQAHAGRMGPDGGVSYDCYQCHGITVGPGVDNADMASGAYYAHGNGEVEIDFALPTGRTPERIEAGPVGLGNGYYTKLGNFNPVTTFPYRLPPFDATCENVYCHGGDSATWDRYDYPGPAPVVPTWNDYRTGSCGSCHGNIGSANSETGGTVFPSSGPTSVPITKITTGSHNDHFLQFDGAGSEILDPALAPIWGPRLHPHPGNASGGCYVCHNVSSGCATELCHDSYNPGRSANISFSGFNVSHADGKVDMSEGGPAQDQSNPLPLGTSPACDFCHGTDDNGGIVDTGAEQAKADWGLGTRLDCALCHQSVDPASSRFDGLGVLAPSKTAFPGHAAVIPSQQCQNCHDEDSLHISGVSADDDRIVQADITTFCQYCHDANATDDAVFTGPENVAEVAATRVSTHSNQSAGYTPPIPPIENDPTGFRRECADCHDPHGTSNIRMVNTTLDGTPGVVFTSDTQFDTVAGAQDVCEVCHTQTQHNGGAGGFHPQSFQDTNQCLGCHGHEYDDNAATADGFMPLQCNTCHTYPGLTGSVTDPTVHRLSAVHDVHVGVPSDEGGGPNKGFLCNKCHNGSRHNSAGISDGTQWGSVNANTHVQVRFDSWNPTAEAGNPGDINLDSTSYNDTSNVCSNLYCHGVTLAAAGSNTAPDWDLIATGDCGTCHDTGTNDTTVGSSIATGNHTDHLGAAYGPAFGTTQPGACAGCHPAYAVDAVTHVNLTEDFANVDTTPNPVSTLGATAPTIDPPAGSTDRCTSCHSTATVNGGVGTVLAKTNWGNGAYQLDCLTCHNGTDPGTNNADGTGVSAPNVLGDDTNFGAEVRGHNRPSAAGPYAVTNNTPANRACGDCHNVAAPHLNNANDTTYAGNRMRSNVNGGTGISTVTGACQACHSTTGTSPATKKDINTHSNVGYAARLEGATFTTDCNQCHEPHGMVANGVGYNIYMMNPSVTVTAGTTVSGVRLEALTGNFSFNDTQGTNADDICTACHTNAANPGFPMAFNADGVHAAPAYSKDERGNNCAACHIHNQDSNLATADGLMPLACNSCHTYPGLPTDPGTHRMSASHDVHVGRPSDEVAVANKGFECAKCHNASQHNTAGVTNIVSEADWAAKVDPNADVQVRFDSWNPAAEANNPVDITLDSTSFVDATNTCNDLYCHGVTLAAAGSDTTPVWTDATTANCGDCHDTGTFDDTAGTSIGTGNHTDHLTALYGPQFGVGSAAVCANCHPAYATDAATHVNLTRDFANLDATPNPVSTLGATAPTLDPPVDSTDRCTNCHSTATVNGGVGTVLAKTNWGNGAYQLDCLTCHNATDPATDNAAGTIGPADPAAPDVLGDDVNYGAEVRGHNRPGGSYTDADGTPTNTAANLACGACHATAAAHFDNTDGATYATQRLLGTINTVAGVTSVTGACNACHATAAGTPASNQVSTHGNTNATFQATANHDAAGAEDFVYRCEACHDVHGLTSNGTGYNIYMVKPAVGVGTSFTTTPGGAGATTAAIRYERVTGTDSLDDGATQTNNMCVACHTSGTRPGSGTALTNSDGDHAENDDYTQNEHGNNCVACHQHNYDSNAGGTVDGFMPQPCNACHSYPGLPTTGSDHLLSATHDIHAGAPGAGPANYAFPCTACHFNFDHNESGYTDGTGWNGTSVPNNTINIRFDTTRNPGAATYGGANASTATAPGVGGTGTCAVLYCHGDHNPADLPIAGVFPAADQGTDTTPVWSNAATGNCGTCHKYTAATANTMATSHPKHAGNTGARYSIGCQACHYGTTTNGTTIATLSLHVNGQADVSFNPSGDVRVTATSSYGGNTAVGSGYGSCTATYCHSNGTDTTAPYDAANSAPATALVWGATGDCGDCHGDGANSMPGYADGTPKANKHPKHVTANPYGCQVCHYTTTTTGTTITAVGNHANRVYTADDNSANNPALDDFNYAGGTCTTTNCHGGNDVAWNAVGHFTCDVCHAEVGGTPTNTDVRSYGFDGNQAKISSTEYAAFGHGDTAPRVIDKACGDCHDSNVDHDTSVNLGGPNPFRLVDQNAGSAGVQYSCSFNAAGCHQSGIIGPATNLDISTFTTHSNEAMGTFKRTWPSWDPQCVNCHDPHGDDTNLSMIHRELYDKAAFGLPAGPPPNEGDLDNTALVFTDNAIGADSNGTSYADTATPFSSVCQECHEAADHVFFKDDTSASAAGHPGGTGNPGDCSDCHRHDSAFKPSGCNSCHGYPPVQSGQEDGGDLLVENYAGGGGQHLIHVSFLATKSGASPTARQLCGPCHGDGAGGTNHPDSGQGTGVWPIAARGFVNIVARPQTSWGASGTYGASSVAAPGTTPPGNTVDATDSRCAGLDCHGGATAAENLHWNLDVSDGGGDSDGLAKSQTCEGCHDETPAQVRVYNDAGTEVYSGAAPDTAAVYYGTLSGYSRGGHGDATINSIDDPSFVDSASGSTPIDCTACHDGAAAHFPEAGGDVNRLGGTAIQTNTGGLCNNCHSSGDYPDAHHPSFYGSTLSNPSNHNIVPASGQEILSAVDNLTDWADQGGGHFEQTDYGAANFSGGVDRFINWWAGSYGLGDQDPPPRPVFYGEGQTADPKAVLPVAQHVGNEVSTNQLMCVTCHNPHGTDLFTFDALDGNASPGGPNASIPDNNMLRLRDSDNTLCNACH